MPFKKKKIIAMKSERTSNFVVYIKVWEVCPLFQLKRCLKRRIHLYIEHLRYMKILMHSKKIQVVLI